MMQNDKELSRLCDLYRDQPDEELLRLWRTRDSFTELAQEAIETVLKERGLHPGVDAEAPEPTPEEREEADAKLASDEIVLRRFSDTLDLNRVIEALKDEGIAYRIHDDGEAKGVILGMRSLDLWLIVAKTDAARAKKLLLNALGIEEMDEAADPFTDFTDFVALGYFTRPDALVVIHALANAGLSFSWDDPSDDPEAVPGAMEQLGADEIAINVRGTSLTRAQTIAEQAFE